MAKAKAGKSLVRWDEQLAKDAEVASAMEANAGGGQFFSTKGGVLTWQDAPMPNNQMAVIIVDHIFETVYYAEEYDASNPQAPDAFAFARREEDLEWHKDSIAPYAGTPVKGSDICEWGSADKGRGKAAKETRRLAMIPAGQFNAAGKFELINDEEHYATTPVGYMRLPITSVKGFAGFVKQVAGALRRPPHGIITKVKLVPDPKNQFLVLFEPIVNVPDALMGAVMKRREEVMPIIDFPYQPREEGEKTTKKGPAKKKARKY